MAKLHMDFVFIGRDWIKHNIGYLNWIKLLLFKNINITLYGHKVTLDAKNYIIRMSGDFKPIYDMFVNETSGWSRELEASKVTSYETN